MGFHEMGWVAVATSACACFWPLDCWAPDELLEPLPELLPEDEQLAKTEQLTNTANEAVRNRLGVTARM
jgi:hypothetical protein